MFLDDYYNFNLLNKIAGPAYGLSLLNKIAPSIPQGASQSPVGIQRQLNQPIPSRYYERETFNPIVGKAENLPRQALPSGTPNPAQQAVNLKALQYATNGNFNFYSPQQFRRVAERAGIDINNFNPISGTGYGNVAEKVQRKIKSVNEIEYQENLRKALGGGEKLLNYTTYDLENMVNKKFGQRVGNHIKQKGIPGVSSWFGSNKSNQQQATQSKKSDPQIQGKLLYVKSVPQQQKPTQQQNQGKVLWVKKGPTTIHNQKPKHRTAIKAKKIINNTQKPKQSNPFGWKTQQAKTNPNKELDNLSSFLKTEGLV